MSTIDAEATDTADLEPRVAEVLDAKLRRRELGPYASLTDEDVATRVSTLLTAEGVGEHTIEDLGRMAGGASKEQFALTVKEADGSEERVVLRIDPRESVVETCRYREAEVIRHLAGVVPVPEVRYLDGDGTHLGQPGNVTSFVGGVAKPPTDGGEGVSGLGTQFSPEWREKLVPQFVDNLAKIHATDWRAADLPHLQAPTADPHQAARWQVNWWARVWREDLVDPLPIVTLAERWLREHLPATDDLVLLHGDYRTGNYLFDPDDGRFTAILDWELTHIGDRHEDLAWLLLPMLATEAEDGSMLCTNLVTREDFIARYEEATGQPVDEDRLRYYEVFAVYRLAVMLLGTGHHSATTAASHQDLMLTWLTALGHSVIAGLAALIDPETTA